MENGDRGENYPAKSKLTRTNTGHPFVSAANLENSKISEKDLLFMTQEQCFRLRSGHIKKGDCLFCIRGSLGKFGFAISDGGAIASSLVILRPKNEIFQDYLMVWIKSDQFKKLISTYSNGSAQPNLGAKVLSSFPIPLPPIPEQHRITTKINQLFKQIDCAEQAYNELSGSLAERFRELCLEKAIQGKLVPQLGTNSPRIAFSRIFCRKISKFIFELLAKVSKSRIQHLQLLLHPIQKLIHVEHFDFGFFFLQPAR